eukprot:TRINITY_DN2710_c3_g1_i1.p1 TRINITY_DN2710_c3_g1~~TRINITY_DN2710_c3_g1_i1.p1  ORF type:complete len:111 (+),score=37.90 TRINITY_DN2710_c3_g1_i1:39-371(+)
MLNKNLIIILSLFMIFSLNLIETSLIIQNENQQAFSLKPTALKRFAFAPETKCGSGPYSCSSSETCCPVSDNKYSCCPSANAVCCPDKVHCCPANTHCLANDNVVYCINN